MLAAKIVKKLCRGRYHAFMAKLAQPEQAQQHLRGQLFHTLLQSDYGKALNAKHWEDIPIVSYNDLAPWVDNSSLTYLPIKHYVETSGMSCHSKRIPYTAGLKASFLNMFKIWAFDALTHILTDDVGKIFMSLSPPGQSGLKDDREYLSLLLKWFLKPYLILPPTALEGYQENVARRLLQEKDLGIISIWNPTYLLQIMDYVEKHQSCFQDLVGKGTIEWSALWPKLQMISCWTDGWARQPAESLKSHFPHVFVQGKGLLATEAPMTVPLHLAPAPVPLIDEVYFEFEDKVGSVINLGQVQVGESYELIISQKGGLVRYRMGDRVLINEHYGNTPCLSFIGRSGQVCDMVGEKLDEIIVEGILQKLALGATLLLPVYSADSCCHYLLLAEGIIPAMAEMLENELQQIYHYRVARQTGQLGPVKVIEVDHLQQRQYQFYCSRGISLGDIKNTCFMHDPSLALQFLKHNSI